MMKLINVSTMFLYCPQFDCQIVWAHPKTKHVPLMTLIELALSMGQERAHDCVQDI